MAIRDRVTIKTKDGSVTGLTVAKQGGTIEVADPTRQAPWLTAQVFDKNGKPSREMVRVAESEIVYYYVDEEPKDKKPKK